MLLNIAARFLKENGETEDVTASGDTLMYGGVHLKQSFGGTGLSDEVRVFQDFGSRIYFMEKIKDKPAVPSTEGTAAGQISTGQPELRGE